MHHFWLVFVAFLFGIGMLSYRYNSLKNQAFEIYDVGGQRTERKKWIHWFNKLSVLFTNVYMAQDCI